ncbi:MAG: hypothetical protein ABI763_15085 [Bacteroidota bacterium]
MKKYNKKNKWYMASADGIVMLALFFFMQSFTPPLENISPIAFATDFYSAGDTLLFSGYKWVTKESNERHTGPGRNFFAGGKENIWVDEQGRMHIRMTHRNGRWYCAEARLVESLGYGKYTFQLESNAAKLDKDLVVGFFTYDHDDSLNHHREIDIEFSTWGIEKNLNSQYVLQPFEVAENVHRYETDLTRNTKHVISWKKGRVTFCSSYVTVRNDSTLLEKYAEWIYKPHQKLRKNMEKFSMNIWLFKADFPSDFNDYEIVVSKFEFVPYKF